MQSYVADTAAAPVNKRRRGFFSQPTVKEDQKAKEDAGSSEFNENGSSSKSEGQSEDTEEASTGDVFRNVIHELKDRGLPVEMHYARTDDGYWIPVVRIPAKGTIAVCTRLSPNITLHDTP